MKNYVKAVLYAYPLLKTVGEDYGEHIRNRALLSYRTDKNAEEIIEYIAGEIIEKRKLEWLKNCVEETLKKLNDVERTLLAIRYFGKERRIKKPVKKEGARNAWEISAWSERKYFRRQKRLGDKVGTLFSACGLQEDVFENEYAQMEVFQKIYPFVCAGRDWRITRRERRWMGL